MSGTSKTRRNVILGMGTALASSSQLPARWSKPVIDSVILPVHAQTSATTTADPTTTTDPTTTVNPTTTVTPTTTTAPTTTPCPNTMFTIPGGSASCGNRMNSFVRYSLDFSSGCPVLTTGGNDVELQFLVNDIRALIKVTIGGTLIRGNLTCNAPRTSRRSGNPTFTASDGSTWQAAVSLSADGIDTVTLQDITITLI